MEATTPRALYREYVLWFDHLGMLDPFASGGKILSILGRGGEGVERHLHRPIADGMKADLKPGGDPLFGHGIELSLLVTRQSAVAGVVGIGRQQGGGSRAQGSIHETLQHSGVQHAVGGRLRGAVRLEECDRIVEPQPLRDPHLQPSFSLQLLIDQEIIPAGIVLD